MMENFGEGFEDDSIEDLKPEISDKQKMIARADDPPVGVHTLTEFIFCPRAGLISYEQRGEDQGEDKPAIYLNYLPQYDVLQMAATWDQLLTKIVVSLCVFGLLLLLMFLGDWFYWIMRFQAVVLSAWLLRLFRNLWILGHRIKLAEKAVAWKPDANSNQQQSVNWWQLLKAGFVSHQYEDPLLDGLWRLSGKPWRVLAFENMRIPVFRYRQYKGKIYSQHRARMAAYCQLIERATGASSPYGIILLGDSYEGISIPQSKENRELFYWQMTEFRKMIRALNKERIIPAAPSPNQCQNCPIGKPIQYNKRKTTNNQNGRPLPPCLSKGTKTPIKYHSPCGDRYCWLPPHVKAKDKGLELL